jgi:cyclase
LCLIAGWFLFLHNLAAQPSQFNKLADGIFVRIVSPDGIAVSNAGVVVLDRSVLLFDTHFTPEAAQDLLKDIRSVTPNPVRYVVNSHAHADHTHGNQTFPEAQLIGSDSARREVLQGDLPSWQRSVASTEGQLLRLRSEIGKATDSAQIRQLREQFRVREEYLQNISRLKIKAPFITLEDHLTLREGKQEVRLLFLGAGHTNGDIILYLPLQKIALVGDLFFNRAIPNVQDSFVLQWMETLEEVLKLDAEKFVPGHGLPGSKKDVEDFLNYLKDLRALVQLSVDRSDSLDQAIGTIHVPMKYASYQFQNFFPANVQKMYVELKELQLQESKTEEALDGAKKGNVEKKVGSGW